MSTAMAILAGLVGLVAGYPVRKLVGEAKINSAEAEAKRILANAEQRGGSETSGGCARAKEESTGSAPGRTRAAGSPQ